MFRLRTELNRTGTANDVTFALAFNPAGQVISRGNSNTAYIYNQGAEAARAYVPDGLNPYDAVGGTGFTHDARGNLTWDGSLTYAYDPLNRLTSITNGAAVATLSYDPLGRLRQITSGGVTSDWLWDGDKLVGEYSSSGTLTARYLHGTGPDEPLAQIQGTRRWFLGDTQGSIIAETDSSGARVGSAITYDPYGQPGSWIGPRFGYTGQMRLTGSLPLWHYKARVYYPNIGRFLQTDPIGYQDSLNLYQYVGNDPVNGVDPTGMCLWDLCVAEGYAVIAAVTATVAVVAVCVATNCVQKTGEAIVGAWNWLTGRRGRVEVGDPVLVQNTADEPEERERGERELGELESIHQPGSNPETEDALGDMTDEEVMDTIVNPENGDPVTVRGDSPRVRDGNTRVREAQRRFPPDTRIPVDVLPPDREFP